MSLAGRQNSNHRFKNGLQKSETIIYKKGLFSVQPSIITVQYQASVYPIYIAKMKL